VRLGDGTLIEYIIDGKNRRVGRKLNGVVTNRWIYNGDLRPVAEVDSVGNIVARYVYAGKENVPEYILKSGVTYRVITDHLGSVRFVLEASTGAIVSRFDYDEYGNVTSSFDSLGRDLHKIMCLFRESGNKQLINFVDTMAKSLHRFKPFGVF